MIACIWNRTSSRLMASRLMKRQTHTYQKEKSHKTFSSDWKMSLILANEHEEIASL